MNLTKVQNYEIRKKHQEIKHQLTEILCNSCESDHEYFLNLIVAQQAIAQMLSSFQDLAFYEWSTKNED